MKKYGHFEEETRKSRKLVASLSNNHEDGSSTKKKDE